MSRSPAARLYRILPGSAELPDKPFATCSRIAVATPTVTVSGSGSGLSSREFGGEGLLTTSGNQALPSNGAIGWSGRSKMTRAVVPDGLIVCTGTGAGALGAAACLLLVAFIPTSTSPWILTRSGDDSAAKVNRSAQATVGLDRSRVAVHELSYRQRKLGCKVRW